jgi:hypothetical protein
LGKVRISIRKRMPSPATGIALAALVVALGGAAFAAIPDPGGTIHGCYQKSNGNLRVTESASDCRSSEQPIDWNRRGPPGATGPDGPPGPPGPGGDARALSRVTLGDGESRVLLSKGALTITASCRLNIPQPTAGFFLDEGRVEVSTTQADSGARSSDSSPGVGRLDPGAPVVLADGQAFHFGTPFPRYNESQFLASAPDGTDIAGALYVAVHSLGERDKCTFGGYIVERTGGLPAR